MGRLDPAGVDLQAKGFREYIRRLEQIEKKNREVFDQQFKDTGKSFQQITRLAKDYERQLKKTEQAQAKVTKSQNALSGALKGAALGLISQQTAQFVVDSAKAAAAFDGQKVALQSLANSYNISATQIRQAITRAADGTLSQAKIMDVALSGLQLQVAKTPEEFERLTAALATIGRARGIGGAAAIERGFLGIGKRELELLDELGLTTRTITREMEILAQQQFGTPLGGLNAMQREGLFVEAALIAAEEAAARFGESTGEGIANFERLTAQVENLKLAFGEAILPSVSGLSKLLAEAAETAGKLVAILAGAKPFIDAIIGLPARLGEAVTGRASFDIGDIFGEAQEKAEERFKAVAETIGVTFPDSVEKATSSIRENSAALEENEADLKALESALKRAEGLQLSFARAAEDAARKQGRQVGKLRKTQEKERDKFLADQIKDFDEFNADLLKDIQSAQTKLNEARLSGNDDRLREQAKLHRDLRQAQDRFNLSQVQSERRFQLSDRRLRAEGDILALQELRENRGLEVQENKENFDLEKSQRKEDGKEQQKERDRQRRETVQALERDLADLQNSFGEQQAAFLADQDEEFRLLLVKQQEQRDAQQLAFREQAEDRRINQARQLEDLGRSLADQEDLTEQGAKDIAAQLEKVFGIDGVADTIFAGFSARTESEFRNLFNTVSGIARNTGSLLGSGTSRSSPRGTGGSLERPLQFQEGGVVPGPIGAPQAAIVHGGETVIPASHTMAAPVIPSQNVNVSMSGGFNITGGEQAGEASVQIALDEMTTSFEIAVRRLIRKG